MSTPPHEGHALPLASFVASRAPTHPLPRLVTDPLVPRVAAIEAALLTSRPAALLLRLGLASERSIVACALVALVGLLARWRVQWRAVLWALGLGEALGRTVRLLQRLAASQAAPANDKGKQPIHGTRDDQDDTAQEAQHVLSFWLLVAALSLLDTLRSSPSAPTTSSSLSFLALPTRASDALRSARRTYLHFVRLYLLPSFLRLRWAGRALLDKYPSLDPAPRFAKWTAFPYALPRLYSSPSSSSAPGASTRRAQGNFPQPRSRPWDPLPTSLPLSWSYFAYPSSSSPSLSSPSYSPRATAAAEARWEIVRLVLLWTGLRRDAWGAKSVVWDWTVAPLLGALPGLSLQGAPSDEGTVLRIVREPRTPAAAPLPTPPPRQSLEHPRPQTSQDDPDAPPSPAPSSAASATPRRAVPRTQYPTPSPYALSWTPPRATAPSSTASGRPSLQAEAQSRASSRTASPAGSALFALQDPPIRGRYRTAEGHESRAAREHPLLGGGRGSGTRRDGAGRAGSSASASTSASGAGEGTSSEEETEGEVEVEGAAAQDSDVDDEEVPPTPGEEEAEEGARRWATVLAEAQAAVDAEGDGVGAALENGVPREGESGWSG